MKKILKHKIVFLFIIIIVAVSILFIKMNSNETAVIQSKETENKEESLEVQQSLEQNETPNKETEEVEEVKAPKTAPFVAENGQTYEKIGTVAIPSLNIEYPILATLSDELLKVSVAKYWGGEPNEVGNLCILGHNYKNAKWFGKLSTIQKDAIIQITDLKGRTLDYKVYETAIVDPNDTSCTSQLTNGNIEVTLITCYYETPKGKATKRFVAKARGCPKIGTRKQKFQ